MPGIEIGEGDFTPKPDLPCVMVAIPTFNRAETLDRAIRSVLDQTFSDLKLLIADDASTDSTAQLCNEWADRDDRVQINRHSSNVGLTENFNSLFAACQAEYFMVLSDDDWLDPRFLELTLDALESDPNAVLAAGTSVVADQAAESFGHSIELKDASAALRLAAYARNPGDGPYYGLVRGNAIRQAGSMPNIVANDWIHSARLISQGRALSIPEARIYRKPGGTSNSAAKAVETLGLNPAISRAPHLVIAWHLFADIAWRSPSHRSVGSTPKRFAVGIACGLRSINWRSLAWHLTSPTISRIERYPLGRQVAALYDRMTSALGSSGRKE